MIPPPLPEIRSEGHCGPPGRGFSSFSDTVGYPALEQHPSSFESSLLKHVEAAHSEQTHAGFRRDTEALGSGKREHTKYPTPSVLLYFLKGNVLIYLTCIFTYQK